MKKTHLVVALTLGFTLTGLVAGVTEAAREDYVDSETQALLDLQAENPTDKASLEMLSHLPALQERDRQINQWAEEYESMSTEEKKRISDAAQKSYDEHMEAAREHEEWLKDNPPKPEPIQSWEIRGVHNEYDLRDSVDNKFYQVKNYWSAGRTTEERYAPIFSAGFKFKDPMQGLVEHHSGYDRNFQYFPSPTATGPLKIVSEKDGILTLISVAGNYPMRDEAGEQLEKMVTTRGGSTYYFDTNRLEFVNQ